MYLNGAFSPRKGLRMDDNAANDLVSEILRTCERLALDSFSVTCAKGDPSYAVGYVVRIEPFLGFVFKQEVYNLVRQHGLAVKENDKGIIIYENKVEKTKKAKDLATSVLELG